MSAAARSAQGPIEKYLNSSAKVKCIMQRFLPVKVYGERYTEKDGKK